MIKHLLTITLIAASLFTTAQTFTATYSFAATTTSTGISDPSTPPTAVGMTFGSFTAVGTNTANQSAGRFSFNGWPIAALSGSTSAVTYTDMGGAIDLAKYYEVTLTPTSGNQMTLTGMDFTARRSNAAPRSFAVRSNVDSYAANLTASVVGTNTVITTPGADEFWFSADQNTSYFTGNVIVFGTAFVDISTPVTLRFYAWNAEVSTGNFTIDDVTFYGSTSVTTGVSKVSYDLNSNFNIYPIPNHDGIIYIENKNALNLSKIEVLDVLGNIVSTTITKNDTKVKLNLSDLSSGNYFVRMHSTNSISTKKIVIVK